MFYQNSLQISENGDGEAGTLIGLLLFANRSGFECTSKLASSPRGSCVCFARVIHFFRCRAGSAGVILQKMTDFGSG